MFVDFSISILVCNRAFLVPSGHQGIQLFNDPLAQSGSKILYHFSVDNEDNFLNDLQSNSLFDSRKIIVCWEVNKLSKKAQKDFLDYIKNNPSEDISLIIISPDFRIKNKFITELSTSINAVDIRTPFPNRMKNWVKYYAKSNRFSMTNELIDFYIDCYGDSLSNVIDQIDKHRIYSPNRRLDIADEYSIYLDNDRKYNYWQFLDSIGRKKLLNSFQIYFQINTFSENTFISIIKGIFYRLNFSGNPTPSPLRSIERLLQSYKCS